MRAVLTLPIACLALASCFTSPEERMRQAAAEAFAEDRAALAGIPRDLRRLLRAHRFAELDARVEGLQAAYEKGANEWAVLSAFNLFEIADPRASADFDAWVARNPDHWPARLGRGIHYTAMGWAARGERILRKTPRENIERMRHYFELARADLRLALERRPRAIAGHARLLSIAQAAGGQDERQQAITAALAVAPASYALRWTWMYALQPKWGGSMWELRQFAEEAQVWREQNPRLYALLGFPYAVAGEQAYRQDDYARAANAYAMALRYAPVSDWLYQHARALNRIGRHRQAMARLDELLAMRPRHVRALTLRGQLHLKLGHMDQARADLEQAVRIDPRSSYASNSLAWYHAHRRDLAAAAAQYSHTLEHHPEDFTALLYRGMVRARQRRLDLARADLEQALKIKPRDATAWREYGDVLHMQRDPAHLDALARYLELADPAREGEMYLQVATYLKVQHRPLPRRAADWMARRTAGGQR